MIFLLLLFVMGTAIRDGESYSVVEMPKDPNPSFKVYWNVPTFQCTSKGLPFKDLYQKFGIIQNKDDEFRGDKIALLYENGLPPGYTKNWKTGALEYKNGRVPQEGNLEGHIEAFKQHLEKNIPNKEFEGIGIIDLEEFKPIFRQNFGSLHVLQNVSYELAAQEHGSWKKTWQDSEAKYRYERAARDFLETTLLTAKKMRPKAKWGYYGYPYCYNMASDKQEACAATTKQENDGTYWLWAESTALFPSLYLYHKMTLPEMTSLIRGRVAEAARLAAPDAPILPYFSYAYRTSKTEYFTETELDTSINTIYNSKASGFLIWGGSNDVNTYEKCAKLHTYVQELLGPAIAKYTMHTVPKHELMNTTTNETETTRPDITFTDNKAKSPKPINTVDNLNTDTSSALESVDTNSAMNSVDTEPNTKNSMNAVDTNVNNVVMKTKNVMDIVDTNSAENTVYTDTKNSLGTVDTNNMMPVKEDMSFLVLHRSYLASVANPPPFPVIRLDKGGIDIGNSIDDTVRVNNKEKTES